MHMIMINTFRIPNIDSPKEEMMIFMSGFLEIILSGLRVLNIFRIDRSTPKLMSITAVETIKKSSFDHEFFK